MQGDRQDQNEYTIQRGRERDADADRFSSRTASTAPRGERQSGQAEFDLGGTAGPLPESGMPELLRQKYYVAEAGASDEAKVYADPRGEYLAFKVSTDRMATRLEDAGVVRDMILVAQHRGWKEVELRGSEEFRRTAWLEASVRGLSVRGYEPDPVDRAALAFRAKPETRSTRTAETPQTREAGASETVSVDGVATYRPIDVTVMPPERRDWRSANQKDRPYAGASKSWNTAKESPAAVAGDTPERPRLPRTTIEVAISERGSSGRPHARADQFLASDTNPIRGNDAIRAAKSQLAAIEHALAKVVRNSTLRETITRFARDRIAEHIKNGSEFKHAALSVRDRRRGANVRDNPEPVLGLRTPEARRER